MHNFDFSEKGLGIVSLTYLVYDFSRKMLLLLILLTERQPDNEIWSGNRT